MSKEHGCSCLRSVDDDKCGYMQTRQSRLQTTSMPPLQYKRGATERGILEMVAWVYEQVPLTRLVRLVRRKRGVGGVLSSGSGWPRATAQPAQHPRSVACTVAPPQTGSAR